jgi:hypothetical protein
MAHVYDQILDEIGPISNAEAIDRYLSSADAPKTAISDLTADQLTAFPVPDTWSIQQIIIHLADTDAIATYRMKRIIAEDHPLWDAYDESQFVSELLYQRQDPHAAAELFRLNRVMTAGLLRMLPDEVFGRAAIHPQIGEMPLGRFLRIYAWHAEHHLRFIEKKRAMVT